jgi:hypothetical protein
LVPQRHFGRCCGQNQSGAIGLSSQKETKCIQFELYKNVVRGAFIKVMDWWNKAELIELHIVDNGECWIICTTMNINKHPEI